MNGQIMMDFHHDSFRNLQWICTCTSVICMQNSLRNTALLFLCSAKSIHGHFGRKPDTYAVVWDTGDLFVVFGQHMETLCSLDLTYYPFDEQSCTIRIGNWMSVDNFVRLRYGILVYNLPPVGTQLLHNPTQCSLNLTYYCFFYEKSCAICIGNWMTVDRFVKIRWLSQGGWSLVDNTLKSVQLNWHMKFN